MRGESEVTVITDFEVLVVVLVGVLLMGSGFAMGRMSK